MEFPDRCKQNIPRWSTNDAAIQDAYDANVKKSCPCVIMARSQRGNFAFTSALESPDQMNSHAMGVGRQYRTVSVLAGHCSTSGNVPQQAPGRRRQSRCFAAAASWHAGELSHDHDGQELRSGSRTHSGLDELHRTHEIRTSQAPD